MSISLFILNFKDNVILLYFRNTVIGRDRDGNDIMADGSINVKVPVCNEISLIDSIVCKKQNVDQANDSNKFDIAACIGSPEKIPSTTESS